jgi:SAM-dependent methyltransferase
LTALEARCRSCGSPNLAAVLSLGCLPLANGLLRADQLSRDEPRYPLDLVFCESCALVQITATVPPAILFQHYLYFTSFSETALRNARELARRLVSERELGHQSLVVEIASNDGYLLRHYAETGIPVVGVEPAANVAMVAAQRGVRTVVDFFGVDLARTLETQHGQADVIHANNVLAHVEDLNGVVAGIAAMLKADGIAVIEVPYVRDLVEKREFDTIYQEHLCYFSLTALQRLFRRHGLDVKEVEHLQVHGGSLRLFIGLGGHAAPSVSTTLAEECAAGADRLDFYRVFGERVRLLRLELQG